MSGLSAPKSLVGLYVSLALIIAGQLVLPSYSPDWDLARQSLEFVDQVVAFTGYIAAPLVIIEAAERMGQFYKYLKSS